MHTLIEAARLLGLRDRRTLLKWMERADVWPERPRNEKDGRRYLTTEQVEIIRRYRDEHLERYGPLAPERTLERVWDELHALRERVEALEARQIVAPVLPAPMVTRAPVHAPVSPVRVLGDGLDEDEEDEDEAAALDAPRIAFSRWCKRHHIHKRTADRLVARGRLPQPEHSAAGWHGPTGQTFHTAYAHDAHIAASLVAAVEMADSFTDCPVCRAAVKEAVKEAAEQSATAPA